MEIIRTSIKCIECKKTLNAPVLLPCGEAVCQEHTEAKENGVYECGCCGANHTIPDEGFGRIKALENIIKTEIEKINLGNEHNEAWQSCNRLKDILSKFVILNTDPNFFINESVNFAQNNSSFFSNENLIQKHTLL